MAFNACSDAIIPLMVEFHIALRSEKLFDDIEIEMTMVLGKVRFSLESTCDMLRFGVWKI